MGQHTVDNIIYIFISFQAVDSKRLQKLSMLPLRCLCLNKRQGRDTDTIFVNIGVLTEILIFSSIVALEMAMSVCRWTFSFLAAYSACSGSFQPSLVWSRLVQTNLVYSSQIQSNLVKSSQIQKNLLQAISGSVQHMWTLFSLVQSGLDQCRPIQSSLVKSSQIQSNLVKSSQIQYKLIKSNPILINLFWAICVDIFGCITLLLVLYSLVQ